MADALVLGASSESLHAMDVARRLGFHVLALDGSPGAPGLGHADEGGVVDIMDTEAVLSFMEGRVPEVILPVPIGRALVSTGRLNDNWGLPGVGGRIADLCTDKYAFASLLRPLGLRPSACVLAEDVDAEPGLLDDMCSPLVVKPRFGSGSRGVSLVSTAQEALGLICPGDIVEEAFPGEEYGLDGIVVRGAFRVLMMRSKVNTPPPVCQCVGYQTLPREHPAYDVASPVVAAIVRELGLKNGLLHADVMVHDGSAGVIELSCRPSGHGIHNRLLPLSTGIDPVETFLRCCVLGEAAPDEPAVDPLFMGFFDLGEGVVVSCPDESGLVGRYDLMFYEQRFAEGDQLEATVDGSVTERGRFILRGGGSDALARARSLLAEFEVSRS